MKKNKSVIKLICPFVGLPGLEPRLTESKSVVLPLHHNPINTPFLFGSAKIGVEVKCTKSIFKKKLIALSY
jgi:hypothetical protein